MVKLFNWNLKLWAVVAVIIIVLAGASIALSNNTTKDNTAIVLSRVNTEGSGIFGNDAGMVTIDGEGNAVFNPDKWKGKVVMTPSAASIQDVMIKEQIKKMGLEYVAYSEGQTTDPNKVTVWPCGVTSMQQNFDNGKAHAGITWEPWYSTVTSHLAACYKLCTTDQLVSIDGTSYKNHACCMVIANSQYLADNSEASIRFLAAIIEATKWINDAKAQPETSDSYKKLISIAKTHTGLNEDAVISSALKNVKYTNELTNFVDEYAKLITSMQSAGQISKTAMDDLKTTPQDFAKAHVDSSKLSTANTLVSGEPKSYSSISIKVAYLSADIHQLVISVAKEMGFFEKYNVSVQLTAYSGGTAVMNSILSGNDNIGFAGAPPTVINTVNQAAGSA